IDALREKLNAVGIEADIEGRPKHFYSIFKKMEKDQGVSQDEIHKEVDEVQKLTDEYIKKIDQALAEREKEIMHI
ncbi:MAG: ribosome recycling factor, partial [Alphaproteobacteria bacterium]